MTPTTHRTHFPLAYCRVRASASLAKVKMGLKFRLIFPPSGREGGIETAIDLFVSGAAGLSPPLSSSGAFVTSPAAPIDRLACLVGGARRPLLIFTAGGGGGGKDETNGR